MSQPSPALPRIKSLPHLTPESQISCPQCGTEISLSEALLTQVAERFEAEYRRKEQVAAALIKQKEDLLARRALLLEEQITKRVSEDQRLKIAEKDKQLDDMRKKIEELKRKSEITSQQLQGEVLELELECMLKKFCLTDLIEPVAKGARGGDIVHKVISQTGQHVGTLIWETKRTKAWKDEWITKIKEDQRAIAAECAIIVSEILPKNITGLGLYEGVWVCDPKTAPGLATALRVYLLQVASAKATVAGKDVKMELIYKYLTSTPFAHRIQSLVEVLSKMQEGLNTEKKALQKIWAQREQQLESMIFNTASVYGSIQGVLGGALPRIDALELPQGLTPVHSG